MNYQPSLKILLVEDDPVISSGLVSALSARNYNITLIEDGKKALKLVDNCEKNSFDLALLDLMLPGANGWEILVRIRSTANTADLPVIILTAIDDESSETRALYDGANDYITKPFTMKVLLARIEANLRKRVAAPLENFEIHFSNGEFEPLSKREKEILYFLTKGYSNKEIGEMAYISDITVANHINKIFQKLKVNSRIQAAIVALKYGIIEN